MNEQVKRNDFIGFEHRDITVKKTMKSVYTDSLPNFGWIEEGTNEAVGKIDSVVMKFKRERKIKNIEELTRLQRQFQACVSDIVSLEKAKTTKSATVAYIVGVIGTALMAGSMFAVTGGIIPLCVLLAIPGFIGWVVPYLMFRCNNHKKTETVNPLIEQRYDEIYDVCEKASVLLI